MTKKSGLDTAAVERHLALTRPDPAAEVQALQERNLGKKQSQIGEDVLDVSRAFRRPNKLRKLGSFLTAGRIINPLPRQKDELTITMGRTEHPATEDRIITVTKSLSIVEAHNVTRAVLSAKTLEQGIADPETVYENEIPLIRIAVGGDLSGTSVELCTGVEEGEQGQATWEALTDPDDSTWGELHETLSSIAYQERRSHVVRQRSFGPPSGGMSSMAGLELGIGLVPGTLSQGRRPGRGQ